MKARREVEEKDWQGICDRPDKSRVERRLGGVGVGGARGSDKAMKEDVVRMQEYCLLADLHPPLSANRP